MEFTIHYLASIQSQKRPNCLRRLIVNIYFGGGPAVGVIVCILLCLTNTPSDIIGKIVFPFQRNAFSSGDRLFWFTSINLVIGWLVKVPSHRTLERRKEELWEFLQAPDERMCMYKNCQSWYLIVYNWNRNACPNKQLYFEPVCRLIISGAAAYEKCLNSTKKGFKIFFAVDWPEFYFKANLWKYVFLTEIPLRPAVIENLHSSQPVA